MPDEYPRQRQTDSVDKQIVVAEEGRTGPEQDLSCMQSGNDDAASEGCD